MLNIDKPLNNSIIIFLIIMVLIYFIKPDILYNHKKRKFKQFNSANTSILPLHVLSLIIAISLYTFFLCLYKRTIPNTPNYLQQLIDIQAQINTIVQNINVKN
jgi:hypothetical protein